MVSEGERIPSIDKKIQEPEGFPVFREIPVFNEIIAGFTHRLFPGIPLRLYAEYFDWTFSGFSIVAVFLICLLFTSNTLLALLAALYYAVSLASVGRTVNGFFEKEIVSLPLILFHLFCFAKYLETRRTVYAVTAAILAVLMLASWKIAQFYYLIFLGYPLLKYLLTKKADDFKKDYLIFFSLQTAGLLLAGLLLPHLREQYFLSSFSMIACFALTAVLFLDRFIALRWWLKTAIFLALGTILFLLTPKSRDYTFIYTIAFYKLGHLFLKPLDPGLLPIAVRAYWVGPFETPSFNYICYTLFTYLVWGGVAVVLLLKRFFAKRIDPKLEWLLFLNLAFFTAYFFFKRLIIFAIVPLAIDAAFLLSLTQTGPGTRRMILTALLLVCVALEWFKTWTYASPSPFLSSLFPSRTASLKYQESGGLTASTTRMLDWIRTGTDRKGNILAKYSLSPSILLYTGRSVVLTPAVFERISSTSKFNSIYTNLYSSENDFYTACRKYGIGYYVYSVDEFLDNSVYSTRYLVNRTNFDTQSAAGLFQFQPQALEHFTLIWQNEYFRIFRITDKRTSPTTETSYYPCYDPDVFGSMGIGHPEFLQKWNRAFSLKTVADQLLMRGQSEQAEQYYNASLEAFPQYPDVLANLGRIYLRRKQIDRAAQTFEKSLSIAYSPEAAYGLTIVSFFRQQNASREQALLSILGRPPFYLPAVFDLVDLYMRRNDIDRAIRLCQKASADHPDRRELYDLLIRIARQTGRPEIERQALMALHKIQSLPSAAAP